MGWETLRYIIVNTIKWLLDMCYITEEKIDLFVVSLLVVLWILFIWDNFIFYFFQSNDKGSMPLTKMFMFPSFLNFIIFVDKDIFFSFSNI